MAVQVGELVARLRVDAGDFKAGLDLVDEEVSKLSNRTKRLGKALTIGVSVPLAAVGVISVRASAQMDSLRRGLVSVTGSAEEAARELAKLKQSAKLPGLGFTQAIQGSIRLQAAGASADLARRSLEAFGNAIALAGGGAADLNLVTLAMTQILSQGKVLGQEIRQLAQRIPQVRLAMIEAFGTARTEDIQALNIEADEFISKMTDALQRLPQATSGIRNAFENVADSVFRARVAIGNALLPVVVPAAQGMAVLAERVADTDMGTRRWVVSLGLVATAAGPALLAISAITVAVKALATALAVGMLPVIVGGAGLIVGFTALTAAGLAVSENWSTLRYEAGRLGDAIKNKLLPGLKALEERADAIGNPFEGFTRDTSEITAGLLNSVRLIGPKGSAGFGIPAFTPTPPPTPPAAAPGLAGRVDPTLLLEGIRDTREELKLLQHEAAFTTKADEVDKLREKLAAAQAQMAALQRAAARFGGEGGLNRFAQGLTPRTVADRLPGGSITGIQPGRITGRRRNAQGGFSNVFRLDPAIEKTRKLFEDGLTPSLQTAAHEVEEGAEAWRDGRSSIRQFIDGIGGGLKDFSLSDAAEGMAGNLLSGGISFLTSSLFGAIGGLFGGSAEDEARRKLLAENNRALDQLRAGIARLGGSLLGERGGDIAGIGGAIETALKGELIRIGNKFFEVPTMSVFKRELAELGLTFEDAQRIAQGFGIELDGSKASLRDFQLALQTDFLDSIVNDFSTGFGLLQQQFQLMGTEPGDQVQAILDLFKGKLGEGFLADLMQIVAGNADFNEFVSNFFDRLFGGDETIFEDLGGVSVQEFLEALGFLKNSMDDLGESTRQATAAMLNVPRGIKVNRLRFDAITGEGLPGGDGKDKPPGGWPPGPPAVVNVSEGAVQVVGVSDPAEAARLAVEGMRRELVRGGVPDRVTRATRGRS